MYCENHPLHLQRLKRGRDKLLPVFQHSPLPLFLCITCMILYGYKAPLCTLMLITLRWTVFITLYRQRKMSS